MSLVAWYPLSKDYINYGLDGVNLSVAGGIPLNGSSNFGGGLNCTGEASKYVHRPGFNMIKDITWCCWVKIAYDTADAYQFIISEGRDNTPCGLNIYYRTSNKDFIFILGKARIPISGAITLGKWYHIAVVIKESGCIAYIDGKQSATFAYQKPTYEDSNNRFVIGKMSYGYTSTTYYFPVRGTINDVRVYDNVLSPKEIFEIAKGLCVHFPMNQMDKPGCNLVNTLNGWGANVDESKATLTKTTYTDPFDGMVVNRQVITDVKSGSWNICCYNIYRELFKPNTKYYYQVWVRSNMDTTVGAISIMASNATNLAVRWADKNIKAYVWTKLSGIATSNTTPVNNTNNQVFYLAFNSGTSGLAMETKQPLVVECENLPLDIGFCPGHGTNQWYNPLGGIEYDTSGFGNHGSSNEKTTPYQAYGDMGPCYDFKAEQRFIQGVNPLIYNLPFTITFWMYYDTSLPVVGTPCVLTARNAVGVGLACFVYSNAIRFDDNAQGMLNTTVHLNKWTHVALVHDTSTKYIYVDGVSIGSAASGNMGGIATTLGVGVSFVNSGAADTNYFRGKLKDFRIYNTAIPAAEIKQMYQARQHITDHSVLLTGEIIN